MNEMLQKTAAALRSRGYDVAVFDTAAQANEYILSSLPAAHEIGIGGCETVHQMGLAPLLREAGHTVHWHRGVPAAEAAAIRRAELLAPCFICSVNAMTQDGLIVQIDGTGNRVAAMCYGPSVVYLIAGRNKIVDGGYQQAVKRIKQIACPQNARRLNLDTPCAKDGCDVSACKNPMCNIFVTLEHAPGGKTTKIVLIDEELGF